MGDTFYIRLPVVRVKDLNPDYFEVIIQKPRKRVIHKDPGEVITVKGPNDEYRPFFIASGTQEPWMRLIIKRGSGVLVDYLHSLKPHGGIYLQDKTFNLLPELKTPRPHAVFIAESVGLFPFLSYFSTHVKEKNKKVIHVDGHGVGVKWLDHYQDLVLTPELTDDILAKIPIDRKKQYHLCGKETIVSKCEEYLGANGISPRKIFAYPIALSS